MRIACVCKTCTPPALKHDMSIQTRHDVRFPAPLFRLVARVLFFLSIFTARRGGSFSARGAQLVDLHDAFGADPWEISGGKRRVQRWTRSRVHINPNAVHTPFFATVVHICVLRTLEMFSSRCVPCANHGQAGTDPMLSAKSFALTHGSADNNLLAPSLQFASLSTYSNQARAWSEANIRWIVALPASSTGCELAPLTRLERTAELSSNHRRDLPRIKLWNVVMPRTRAACSTRAMQCSEFPQTVMSSEEISAATATLRSPTGS